MNKPILDAHTIKVMNEQGVATKKGDTYINTRPQGHQGTLVFTFDRVLTQSFNPKRLYRLDIELETTYGNIISFKHKLTSDQIKPIYEYVSSVSDKAEKRSALNLANELNSHYKQFDSILD